MRGFYAGEMLFNIDDGSFKGDGKVKLVKKAHPRGVYYRLTPLLLFLANVQIENNRV